MEERDKPKNIASMFGEDFQGDWDMEWREIVSNVEDLRSEYQQWYKFEEEEGEFDEEET